LGHVRMPSWGDDEKPKTHRLSAPASEPIRWRNKDWPNQPESAWRVRCTCGESFGSVQHEYALAEAQAHLLVSGAATPLSHSYWLAKRFQAGTAELDDVVFPDKDDYLLRDLLADAVAAIPRARPEPRPENEEANERRRVKLDKKVCAFVHCDTVFTPSRKTQRFCKPSHKVAQHTREKLQAAQRVARA
jgi:hypothetical protein